MNESRALGGALVTQEPANDRALMLRACQKILREYGREEALQVFKSWVNGINDAVFSAELHRPREKHAASKQG